MIVRIHSALESPNPTKPESVTTQVRMGSQDRETDQPWKTAIHIRTLIWYNANQQSVERPRAKKMRFIGMGSAYSALGLSCSVSSNRFLRRFNVQSSSH
jgi:hypothetical protein